MLEHADWIVIFLGAVGLTIALLGLGAACGYRLGVRVGARIIPAPSFAVTAPVVDKQLDLCHEVSTSAAEKMRALMELLLANRQTIPPNLQCAIEELISATKTLRRQLEQLARAVAPAFGSPPDTMTGQPTPDIRHESPAFAKAMVMPGSGEAASLRLTGDELQSLTSLAGIPADNNEHAKRRYPYDCQQTLYPWMEDDCEAIGPGVAVRCHDISGHGISFFWPDPPYFQRLIISLGNSAAPEHMAAEVTQSKAVYMHGEVHYLVACRFTGRVPEFMEANRVQFNRRRVTKSASGDADMTVALSRIVHSSEEAAPTLAAAVA